MPDKLSLLVVDDDVNFCNSLAKILDKKGYEVTKAEGGPRALEFVKERSFDVVLMDIKMPVMNGVETFKKMKEIRPGVTVILMTAFSVDALIQDALKEGVFAVAHKPLDLNEIIRMIEGSKSGAFVAVVDDNPNINKTLKNILEKNGYSVTCCQSPREAIDLAKERRQDIFLIDMKMPVMNGVETYLEIKKIIPKASAVMMTAYREETSELTKQAIEQGAYACIYKPLDVEKLMQLLESILSDKRHA
jgi:two-component system, NtrC family, response regulator HydG